MYSYKLDTLKRSLTATLTLKLHVHTFWCCILPLYYSLRLVNENQSSSKTACAAEIFDFFLDFLEEPCPNSTNSLSGASGAVAGAGAEVSSSITCSDLSIVGRLGLTDSNESLNASSESLDSSLAESLLNSESD
jgi:hypothetical protein